MQLTRGQYIAFGASAIISVWMLSGLLTSDTPNASQAPVTPPSSDLFAVQVERFEAQAIVPELLIHGETAPSRQVQLSSEISGKVTKVHAREGDFVEKGQVIIEIDPQGLPQQLLQANALVKQRTLEFKANQTLIGKGLQNETRLAESEAMLASAKAQLADIKVRAGATQIRAPFSGILEGRRVELGTFLSPGDPVIQLLDYNPFIIKGFTAEKDLTIVKPGTQAKGKTLDGTIHQGTIRYVSSQANKASRTFAVELEIANPSERQADGVTADIFIPTGKAQAVFVSPALLSLNQDGILGAKYVKENIVNFAPVNLIKAEANGIWISGLPSPVDLIVTGASFVSPGEKVQPVFKNTPLNADESMLQAASSGKQVSDLAPTSSADSKVEVN